MPLALLQLPKYKLPEAPPVKLLLLHKPQAEMASHSVA
jgi:hypothetical protein